MESEGEHLEEISSLSSSARQRSWLIAWTATPVLTRVSILADCLGGYTLLCVVYVCVRLFVRLNRIAFCISAC